MKKIGKKIHFWLSVPAGFIISIVCLAGAALSFEQEITRLLHPEWSEVQLSASEAGRTPLPPSQLIARVQGQVADTLTVSSVEYASSPTAPVLVSFRQTGRKQLVVHPYTGKVVGWKSRLPFFTAMFGLHRWLLDAPKEKTGTTVGRTVVGWAVLCMVVILLTGIAVWMPRTVKGLRSRTHLSVRGGFRRFAHDTHRVLGIYAVLFLLVMALTGLTWSFPSYRSAVVSLFGMKWESGGKSAARGGKQGGKDRKSADRSQHRPSYAVWDAALAGVRAHYAEYTSLRVDGEAVAVNIAPQGAMKQEDRWEYDARTGAPGKCTPHDKQPDMRRAHDVIYALHTGMWGGGLMRFLYFLAALLGGTLPLTGFWIWWHRKRMKRTHSAKGAVTEAAQN